MTHGHVFAQAKHGKTPGSPRGDWKVRKPIIKPKNTSLPRLFPKAVTKIQRFHFQLSNNEPRVGLLQSKRVKRKLNPLLFSDSSLHSCMCNEP